MNCNNLIRQELIGKKIKIINSSNKNIINLEGMIVDETYHTFKILIDEQIKVIFKKKLLFAVEIDDNKVIINGDDINKRPEERIKVN
jgi:RNase P/RNase MRP subunit p29